jgi:hypothetical protein
MSGAPTGWQTPRTTWQAADAVSSADLNRAEGNSQAIELGDRTVDQAQTPSGHVGTLRQFLSWIVNRLKAITGATHWYSTPATTLAAAKSHVDSTSNPHAVTKAQVSLGNVTNDAQVRKGAANTDIDQVFTLLLPTDTRSVVATVWDADGHPTNLEVRDGANVLVTITRTYTGGKLTQQQATGNGVTITWTITWSGDNLQSVTKAVA